MTDYFYSTDELMTVAISRLLHDDELGFVGLGTAARAFRLAVAIPIAASRLAQIKHAPGFSIYWGNLLSPTLNEIPDTLLQSAYTNWPASASPADVCYKVDMVARGHFDVSFESAAQIDQHGNLNITEIGAATPPQIRLVGCLAQTEHLAFVKRPIIVADLKARTFVPKVDFITSAGYLDGANSRQMAGLTGPGPHRCITNKAVFDFHPITKKMRLCSLHPGVTLDEIFSLMGFEPLVADNLEETPPPSQDDIRLIREVIDPHGTLISPR